LDKLKALDLLQAFEERVDWSPLSELFDDLDLHVSAFKLFISAKVTQPNQSTHFLIGNRFHVCARVLSP